ncbi:MAG: hypothetical protein JSS10_09445 [Verrucomicrobia bacterium]|nr:hypothetical protein [Verrucomicrobiota bacterium]
MNNLPTQYLTKKQAIEKYPFLSENMLKNLLFKNIGFFRDKVVKKIGRRIILDEVALLLFLSESNKKERMNGTS